MRPHMFLSTLLLVSTAVALDAARVPAPLVVRPARIVQRLDSQWVRKANELLAPERLKGRVLEDVAAELAAAGPNAIQAYFAILSGTVDGPLAEGAHFPPADAIDPDAVLVATLARMNPSQVALHVAAAVSGDAKLDVKIVALRVLSESSSPEALDAWLEIAQGIGAQQLTPPYVKSPCEDALASILSADARLFTRLTQLAPTIATDMIPYVAAGVANSRRKQGLPFLTERLGHDHELDMVLLPCIATLVETTTGELGEDEITWLRPFGNDLDWRVRREALLALGRVQDWRMHAEFAAALSDEQRPVQQAAHWALTHMSNVDFGFDKAAWNTWFEAEIAWYETRGGALNQGIKSGKPATALEALRELVAHPLFRHEVARTASSLCASDDEELVAHVCAVLRDLGSPAACPALVEALASEDASIRESARGALSAITHLEIAPDLRLWRRALVGT